MSCCAPRCFITQLRQTLPQFANLLRATGCEALSAKLGKFFLQAATQYKVRAAVGAWPQGLNIQSSAPTLTPAPPQHREKLVQRIKAVPDARLLLESDHNTPTQIDASLDAILDVVCEAKGWDRQHAAQQAMANFDAFFATERQA